MFDYHFDRMGKALVKSGVVPEDRRAEAEAALKLAWRCEFALSWTVVAVLDACPGLTEEEAEEVIEEILEQNDTSEGVIREMMEAVAIDLFGERALEGSEDEDDEDDEDTLAAADER